MGEALLKEKLEWGGGAPEEERGSDRGCWAPVTFVTGMDSRFSPLSSRCSS